MIQRFHFDELGYTRWREATPGGFVFNHFGGSNAGDNKVHAANCSFLGREKDEGARTVYEKVCSESLQELRREADRLRGGPQGWTFCAVCMGKSRT